MDQTLKVETLTEVIEYDPPIPLPSFPPPLPCLPSRCTLSRSSVQDGIYALGKTRKRSATASNPGSEVIPQF